MRSSKFPPPPKTAAPPETSTMDWRRKHLCDLVSVCGKYQVDQDLAPAQRKTFAAVRQAVKQLASLPQAGGAAQVAAVIAQLCAACLSTARHPCPGRSEWRDPCVLMRRDFRQE